jgi:WD40 repeat protein
VTVLRGHADDVSSVIFAGPHILVSGSLDQTVRTWAFDAGDMVPREPAAFRAWLARTTTVALTDRGGDAASP